MWSLPTTVEIDGVEYKIRNECDYRVVLDVISALNDDELDVENRIICALFIFYENLEGCQNINKAVEEMYRIIDVGEEHKESNDIESSNTPKLMDWEHDFKYIAPAISRVLGYSVRDAKTRTHWYDFVGAYMEIGECTFSTILSIRSKRQKGEKLEKWEQKFYKENKKIVDLPHNFTDEEREWLESDW